MKILVIAPHCDDAELGCGGYIARRQEEAAASGEPLEVLIYVAGASNYRRNKGDSFEIVDKGSRITEQKAAAKILGAKWRVGLGEENRFQEDLPSIINDIEKHVLALKPDVILAPLPSFNQDHKAVWDACQAALRPGVVDFRTMIWAYENPWQTWGPPPPPSGQVYVRLTQAHLALKMQALKAHTSQFTEKLGGDVAALALHRGRECGAPVAEMFYVLRGIA